MNKLFVLLFSLALCTVAIGQVGEGDSLFSILESRDSLLFTKGFNECDTETLREMVSDDFIFYHDQSGITPSKEAFIESIKNGLCALPYHATRALDEGSLVVYPLYNNGVLYGAIQNGSHRFYAQEGEAEPYLTSTAKFTHLWILEDNIWKLKSVLSFDHKN